jgi:hypothetical protein
MVTGEAITRENLEITEEIDAGSMGVNSQLRSSSLFTLVLSMVHSRSP